MRAIDADALIEFCAERWIPLNIDAVNMQPTIQPEKAQLFSEDATSDLISKFIDGLEEIFADLRERHVDDSVCGLCEYDGAYMGQSGDWCNECPGFDRDDCFKLSDKTRKEWTEEIIKALPTVQPVATDICVGDTISRQAARHALCKAVHKGEDIPCENQTASCLWTGTRVCDFVREIDALPPAQPEPHEGRFERKRDGVFCSVCHYGWEFITGVPAEVEREYHYCPNCGADMRGKQDG